MSGGWWAWAVGAALATCIAAGPEHALAWDAEGHRIIAHLAYERLTPRAKAAVASLITHPAEQGTPACAVATFEDASTWPDCIRGRYHQFDYLAVMHFEDVPICGTAPKTFYCPDGRCITNETRRAVAILGNRRRPTVERLQALEEVAHFIGDMHQPLHAADNEAVIWQTSPWRRPRAALMSPFDLRLGPGHSVHAHASPRFNSPTSCVGLTPVKLSERTVLSCVAAR